MTLFEQVQPARERRAPVPAPRPGRSTGLAPARMAFLRATGLLDEATQDFWDGLTGLAARLLNAPLAVMTLLDGSGTLRLARVADAEHDGAGDREVAALLCLSLGDSRAPLVVPDAAVHEAWDLRKGRPRSWVVCPLTVAEEAPAGALCVLDVVPREWTDDQVEVLEVLARSASAQLALLAAHDDERSAQADLAGVRDSERRAERRLERLAFVALELLGAATVEDLTEIVVNNGLPVLGADGGAVVVRADGGMLKAALSDRLGEQARGALGELPIDDPLPAAFVARTGIRLVLPTRRSGLLFAPEMSLVYETTQRNAWVFTPLVVAGRLLGSLAASWVEEHDFTLDELTVLDAFAAQCAQALDRIRLAAEATATAARVQQLSVALQRSLLTQPPTPGDLDIVVRYLPAVHEAQIGGDWYDAFEDGGGGALLSVGDVAGHDRNAAASMAQLRNVLRGLAVDSTDGPAQLLTRLDFAIDHLALDTLATAVVARLEPAPDGRAGRQVRWSSAGHMPPLVRDSSGDVRILSDSTDLLLGLDPLSPRADRVAALPEGSTLILFTDGLVERRGESLDDGLERLAAALSQADGSPSDVARHLLAEMLPEPPDDDVVLLVVR